MNDFVICGVSLFLLKFNTITMSGHSKWAQIKRQKAVNDDKRGKVFSQMSKIITVAAKEGGDPNFNPKLRLAIERAYAVNMTRDNIERAIKKGTGELGGETIETVTYEAYGPGKSALIIEAITDNRNRTTSEIKHVLTSHGGRMAEPGSVKWMFAQNGSLEIAKSGADAKNNLEEIELAAIEAGALDVKEKEENVEVYTEVQDWERIRKDLEAKKFKIVDSRIEWVPQNTMSIDNEETRKQIETLFEALGNHDDVDEIYSNINNF